MRVINIDPISHIILNVSEVDPAIISEFPNWYLSEIGNIGDIFDPSTGTVVTPPETEASKESRRTIIKTQMNFSEQAFILNRGSRELQLTQISLISTTEELAVNSYYQKLLVQEQILIDFRTQLHNII